MIEVENLQKRFWIRQHHHGLVGALRNLVTRAGREVRAVAGISFRVAAGEMVGYIGPNNRLVTAVRGLVDWVDGSDVPFFELSALGGAETLRGFGAGRFLDKGRFLLNAEERIKVWQFTYGKVRTDVELALFADMGQVFHSFGDLGSGTGQVVGGGGVRYVAGSRMAGKIDVGYGSEGVAVFVGLGYPF